MGIAARRRGADLMRGKRGKREERERRDRERERERV
jgi:hypothetical protein